MAIELNALNGGNFLNEIGDCYAASSVYPAPSRASIH